MSERCDFPTGTVVNGRYQLQEVIEGGGQGVVYRARDTNFKEWTVTVALKFLKLRQETAGWRWKRFEKEAAKLAALNHAGLVKVTDLGVHDDFLYYVMEYLGPTSLRTALKEHPGGMPLEPALALIEQMGRALARVHSEGMYHCDFKPANVMLLDGLEQAKIIDFGIARLTDSVRGQEENLPREGTIKYMAPEQFNIAADSAQITAATDVYALATVAFLMLTGQHPFGHCHYLEIPSWQEKGPPELPSRLRAQLNPAVDAVLRRGLAYLAEERYRDAKEFAESLAQAVKTGKSHTGPTLPRQVLLLATDDGPDQDAAQALAAALGQRRHEAICLDSYGAAAELEAQLRAARLVVGLVSSRSLDDPAWQTLAQQAANLSETKRLRLVFLVLQDDLTIVDEWRYDQLVRWRRIAPEAVAAEILSGQSAPAKPPETPVGALCPGHPLYVERAADARFLDALANRRFILLARGPRQFGKTSLLMRGLERARQTGFRVVFTDCQKLDGSDWADIKTFYLALGQDFAHQLQLSAPSLATTWYESSGPNKNWENYMRDVVLAGNEPHLFWVLDEADRIFGQSYCNDVFSLQRSWHSARSSYAGQGQVWHRLTLAIGYSAEASRFITDPYQSPFNVGRRFDVSNFDLNQVAALNSRYGYPLGHLGQENKLADFYAYTGGHPYLTQRGLGFLARRGADGWNLLQQGATHLEGPFGDHLRYVARIVAEHPNAQRGLVKLLQGDGRLTHQEFDSRLTYDEFYDLWAPGLVAGSDPSEARLSSQLYADFFRRALALPAPSPPGLRERLRRRFWKSV